MLNKLIQGLESVSPAGIQIPAPLIQLYEWIESKQLYKETEEATYGFLFPAFLLAYGVTPR